MKRALLLIIVGALYCLHQDFWFWRSARPLAFGFIPIGLFYHACYTIAIAVVMWLLIKQALPSHLEEQAGDEGTQRRGDGGSERVGETKTSRPLGASPGHPLPSAREGTER